jgi:PilZ domain-containing protein
VVDRRNRERRSNARSRVLKGVKLILDKSSVMDCVVRNVTNNGARLHLPNTIDLPEVFDLTFDGGYSFRRCRIMWRSVTEAGVQFI